MKAIRFAKDFLPTVLACPRCGGGNLHQEAADLFWCTADEKVTHTKSGGGRPTADTALAVNPSPRHRDGLRIFFSCESCSETADLSLVIYQHKGSTFVEWETH